MEVFIELFESEVSIIVPHIAEIVNFCLEVRAELLASCLQFNFGLNPVIYPCHISSVRLGVILN